MTATLVRRSGLARAINVHPATIPKLVGCGAIPPQITGTQYWVLEDVIAKLRGQPEAPALTSAFDEWKRARDARSA